MTPERLIARRYLRARHDYGFISLIGYLGMIGLAIGVAALILTFSIMRGFRSEVERKLAGLDGHIRLSTALGDGTPLSAELLGRLADRPEVIAVTPFVVQNALARHGRISDGVLLLGIDWGGLREAIEIESYLTAGSLPDPGTRGELVLGAKLARSLRVSTGDRLHLFDINYLLGEQGLRGAAFTVAAIFRSGMLEYDRQLAFAALPDALRLFGLEGPPSRAILSLTDRNLADPLALELGQELGYPYYFTSWRQRHANLFAWLNDQQLPILIVFGFIALVALVNIFSTLSLVVLEKFRDIGILRGLGFSRRQIRRIFLYQGGMVGLVGSLSGLLLAVILGLLQSRYHLLSLDADIYFMDYLPVQWTWRALAGIPALALGLSLLAAFWPSRKAASILPAEALRYE